jgi:hypothetical protein
LKTKYRNLAIFNFSSHLWQLKTFKTIFFLKFHFIFGKFSPCGFLVLTWTTRFCKRNGYVNENLLFLPNQQQLKFEIGKVPAFFFGAGYI